MRPPIYDIQDGNVVAVWEVKGRDNKSNYFDCLLYSTRTS